MENIPEQINTTYLQMMNQPTQATVVVAQTVNKIIRYLLENKDKIASLPDFSKDIREQS